MAIFDTFGIAGSGLMTHRKWLDAVSDNIANVNTVRRTDEDAFQQRMVVAEAVEYGTGEGGVRVARAEFGSAEGRLVYQLPDRRARDGWRDYEGVGAEAIEAILGARQASRRA